MQRTADQWRHYAEERHSCNFPRSAPTKELNCFCFFLPQDNSTFMQSCILHCHIVQSLTGRHCAFQGTTSGYWTETWFPVRRVASRRCGVSRLPLTPCSRGATAREKHTSSRYIDWNESWKNYAHVAEILIWKGIVAPSCFPSSLWHFFGLCWLVIIAGAPVLEVRKWCFRQRVSKAHCNRIWWTAGPHHSCSVCAAVPE